MLLKITREDIDRVKWHTSIAAVILDRGIELEGRGRHLFARCPFHRENTPSFCVTESKGLFHCFGCGVAGDVIGFVVRYDKLSFPDAVRKLATRAGITLQEEKAQRARTQTDACGRTSWR